MVWTHFNTQDDPDSGFEFDAKGRNYRQNDNELCLEEVSHQNRTINLTGLNQTPTNVIATGVTVRVFIPAWAMTLRIWIYMGKQTGAAVRVWARFRVDPAGAAIDSTLGDSNVSASPWELTADVTSLAEGYYTVEVYAGHAGVSGDFIKIHLPSGRKTTEGVAQGAQDNFYVTAMRVDASPIDWSTSPASDVTIGMTTQDEAVAPTIQMFYDRDEKLRRRSAPIWFSEVSYTNSGLNTGLVNGPLIYVPAWADVLEVLFEMRVSGGGGEVGFSAINPVTGAEVYTWWDPHHSQLTGVQSSTSYVFYKMKVNLAAFRGKEVRLGIRIYQSTAGQTTYARALVINQGSSWSAQPMNTAHAPAGNKNKKALLWRYWPVDQRGQFAFLCAGFWRRMTNRDRDLLERSFSQRRDTGGQVSVGSSWFRHDDSSMKIRQIGMGASGGKIVMAVRTAASLPFPGSLRCDYTDFPDGHSVAGATVITNPLVNTTYLVSRPARSDRDGTDVTVAIFSQVEIVDLPELDSGRMRWELP